MHAFSVVIGNHCISSKFLHYHDPIFWNPQNTLAFSLSASQHALSIKLIKNNKKVAQIDFNGLSDYDQYVCPFPNMYSPLALEHHLPPKSSGRREYTRPRCAGRLVAAAVLATVFSPDRTGASCRGRSSH